MIIEGAYQYKGLYLPLLIRKLFVRPERRFCALRILLISGFLGSGKTTFLLNITEDLVNAGNKVAVLVNEVGEIGIDGKLMKQLDVNVWEMSSGCICCSLISDLLPTLESLKKKYIVDTVLIEPSGIAEPNNILKQLEGKRNEVFYDIRVITMVDSLRFTELFEVLTPLLTKQVVNADVVLINKIDAVEKELIDSTSGLVRKVNPRVRMFSISATDSISDQVKKELML